MSSSVVSTFVGAIQASASVLLTIFYGVVAGQTKLLSVETGRQISKICIKMFLPALLVVNLGTQIEASNALQYILILGKPPSSPESTSLMFRRMGTRLQPRLNRNRLRPHQGPQSPEMVHARNHLQQYHVLSSPIDPIPRFGWCSLHPSKVRR